jgi:hypothetical protein
MESRNHLSNVMCRPVLSASQRTRRALLCAGLGLLVFSLGCGSSSRLGPISGISGNFSNSNLNGSYAYQISGTDTAGGDYREAGVFTADGNGHITSGTDDFNQNGAFTSNAISGTYSMSKDGNGTMTLNLPNNGGSFNWTFTMVSGSQLYITEADAFVNFSANASGIADKQTPNGSNGFVTPSGTFVTRIHAISTNSTGIVGVMTSTSGVVSGTLDVINEGGLESTVTITTGTFSTPGTTGRGTFSYTDSNNVTRNFEYYIINGTTLRLLGSDANILAVGRAEGQSATTFSNSSVSGGYAFGSQGDTLTSGQGGVRSVGAITASAGAVTGGAYDSVQDGNSVANQAITSGTYAVGSNGRTTVTLNPSAGNPISLVLWLVSSSRGFFLINDSTKVEDGTMDLQSSNSFTNSNLNGQYALVMDGYIINSNFLTRVGTFIPNGAGTLNLNEIANSLPFGAGSIATINQPGFLPGTYAVASNGRATATITNLSLANNDIVLYLVSPSKAYVLQSDVGVEISGTTAVQTTP